MSQLSAIDGTLSAIFWTILPAGAVLFPAVPRLALEHQAISVINAKA
jgi:hypothetical protein